MAEQTTNYGLTKPSEDDFYNIQDFNSNMDIIDTEIKEVQDKADQAFQSASDGKKVLATAITGKGIPTSSGDTFQRMADNIGSIETDKTGDATATAGDLLQGKTAYAKGDKLTGTMPNNGSKTFTPTDAIQTSGAGYYSGIAVNPRPALSGSATEGNVLAGTTFYNNNYTKRTGTMPNRGAVSQSLPINGSYAIPAGYHNGSGKVTQSIPTKAAQTYTPGTANQTIAAGQYLNGVQTIKGDANLIPANILSGKSIFGVAGNVVAGKHASGMLKSSSDYIIVDYRTGTSSSLAYGLTVSGLTFKPKAIFVEMSSNPTSYFTTYVEHQQADNNYTILLFRQSYGDYIKANSKDVYINSTGFCLPVTASFFDYNWYAWG